LFRDEIVDIDFGAIDAYTSALNAQINSAQSGGDASNSAELSFPSHILTSNHATFLDNQMLLGDATYYAQDELGGGGDDQSSQNQGGSEEQQVNSNVAAANAQLLNSFRDFENSTSASFAHLNVNNQSEAGGDDQDQQQQNEDNEDDDADRDEDEDEAEAAAGRYEDEQVDYSNSHSFGSVVDIDNGQPGYTIGNFSNFNFNNLNLNTSQNYETLDGKSSKQQQQSSNSGIYYLNSENQENFYVR
jgi:hypothetical protein